LYFGHSRFEKVATTSIGLSVGENGPFRSIGASVYEIRRTLNLKLENIDPSSPLSGCTVAIYSVAPDPGDNGPWLLKDDIAPIAAGASVYIPLATYGEARDANKYPCADSFLTTETANNYPLMDVLDNE